MMLASDPTRGAPLAGCVGDSPVGPADAASNDAVADAGPPGDAATDAASQAPFPSTLAGVVVWLDAQASSSAPDFSSPSAIPNHARYAR